MMPLVPLMLKWSVLGNEEGHGPPAKLEELVNIQSQLNLVRSLELVSKISQSRLHQQMEIKFNYATTWEQLRHMGREVAW